EKLRWIAECGGMALVNVHPDYVSFGAKSHSFCSYPALLYAEFLTWLKQEYAGEYWHVQPANIAKFIRSSALQGGGEQRPSAFARRKRYRERDDCTGHPPPKFAQGRPVCGDQL